MEKLIVSVDQEECTSCGLCPEYSKHFFMGDDDFAYVTTDATMENAASPIHSGMGDTVDVALDQHDSVIDIAERCPGACIYVEVIPVAVPVG
jgi:ferredoxin